MITLYTFESHTHYSDYVMKLRFPSYQRRVAQPDGSIKIYDIAKPLGIGIDTKNILETDLHLIEKLFKERYKATVSGCPLCFWNGGRFAWLKPEWEERKKPPNYLRERWTLCIHHIFDIDFISKKDARGNRSINREALWHFEKLKIDWKKWLSQLESRKELSGDGNGKYLRQPVVSEDRQLEEPAF